jgi:mono/diheme cytochrome c family protein
MSSIGYRVRKPWVTGVAAIVAVSVVAGAAIALHMPNPQISVALAQRQPDVAHGEYVAKLGDCVACHTTTSGKPFAGGLPFPTPVGTVHSTNITPDREKGIGNYDFKDFVRVMRFGVTPDGTHLYPAMPYRAYAKVSDEDLQDLFAYLQEGVAPVHEAAPANAIRWPLSMRWPLAFWNLAFPGSRFTPDASKDAQWNRGSYLVQGLAHCGTCHTPRGLAFQEKDVSGTTDLYLSGTQIDGSSPTNLRSNPGDGLGRWSASDIAELLKTGRNAHSAVTGSMTEVIAHSTQYMTDGDIAAIAAYLKSLSPAPDAGRATYVASDATTNTIMAGREQSPGGRIFMDSCAACHRLSGRGEDLAFPSLAGNPSVLTRDPSSLISVILSGARLPSTAGAPTGLAMPPFGWRYNDAEVAELATFIRSSWGNTAPAVVREQVTGVRKQLGLIEPDRAGANNR